jgi:hypothetical protein
VPTSGSGCARHGPPPTYEAYRAFDRGIRLYNAGLRRGRRKPREAGGSIRLSCPAGHAATAAWNRGEQASTDSLVKMLRARQASLSEYFDLNVTYLENLLAGEGDRALQVVRQAAALAPGSRAPYNAARLALLTNHPAEALTRCGMDPRPGPDEDGSRIDPARPSLHLAPDHERELGATRDAAALSQQPGGDVSKRGVAALGRADDGLTCAQPGAAAGYVLVAGRGAGHRGGGVRGAPDRDPAVWQTCGWLVEPAGAESPAPRASVPDGERIMMRGAGTTRSPLSSLARSFDQMDFVGLNAVNVARFAIRPRR